MNKSNKPATFSPTRLPDQLLGNLLEPDKEEERDPPGSCAFLATKPQLWRL